MDAAASAASAASAAYAPTAVSAPMVHIQAAFPSVNNNNDYDNTVPSFAQNAVSQINTNITPNITSFKRFSEELSQRK